MNRSALLRIICYLVTGGIVLAQPRIMNVSDFSVDNSVSQITEVVCRVNYDNRKCEKLYTRVLTFAGNGLLVSEERRYTGNSLERTVYTYDDQNRIISVNENGENRKYIYKELPDTLEISEVSGGGTKLLKNIYDEGRLLRTLSYSQNKMDSKTTYSYSRERMTGKKVQFYKSNGEMGPQEEHQYRSGKISMFRKKNDPGDNKTCYYRYNNDVNALAFEEVVKPGKEAVISRDCSYLKEGQFWVAMSEEHFFVPNKYGVESHKQKHIFYFRKLKFHDGSKIGNTRIRREYVKKMIE